LYQAVKLDKLDEVRELLEEGADPIAIMENGNSAFQTALICPNYSILTQMTKSICLQFKRYMDSLDRYQLHSSWIGYISGDVTDLKLCNIRIVGLYNNQPLTLLPMEFRNIKIYWRQKHNVSLEARSTLKFEDIDENLKQGNLNKDAEKLFKKHSNLTIVHLSSCKSRHFASANEKILKQPCIALYCHIKGIIPLGEREFEKSISGLETDVREGFCSFTADTKLRPGTAITCKALDSCGTIGGFVEDRQGRTAFVTAAHVVTNCSLRRCNNEEKSEFLNSTDVIISRAADPDTEVGKVIDWCFSHGDQNQTSVDAALVLIDKQSISTDNQFENKNQDGWSQAGMNTLFNVF